MGPWSHRSNADGTHDFPAVFYLFGKNYFSCSPGEIWPLNGI